MSAPDRAKQILKSISPKEDFNVDMRNLAAAVAADPPGAEDMEEHGGPLTFIVLVHNQMPLPAGGALP